MAELIHQAKSIAPSSRQTAQRKGGVVLADNRLAVPARLTQPIQGKSMVVQCVWQVDRSQRVARWDGPGPKQPVPFGYKDVTGEMSMGDWEEYSADQEQSFGGGGFQSQLWTVPGPGGKPTLGSTSTFSQFGKKRAEDISEEKLDIESSKKFGSAYRMPQVNYSFGGGSGFDEKISTATAREHIKAEIRKGADDQQISGLMQDLSREREPVANLLWTADDYGKPPIAGHPGALTTVPGDMRYGVTTKHNTKDSIRAAWVKNQLASGGDIDETAAMADIMTNQLMSEPFSQLTQVPNTSIANVHHAVHGNLDDEANWHNTKAEVHNEREIRKAKAAQWLIENGYGGLVHPEMMEKMKFFGSWENSIRNTPTKQDDFGPPQSQAFKPIKESQPETLKDMIKNKRVSVSPPRVRIGPYKKKQPDLKKMKQPTLFDMFGKY